MKDLEGSDAAWTARITRAWRTADKVLRKWWGQIRHGVETCGRHVFMNHVAFQSLHNFSNTTLLAIHSSSCPSLWHGSLGIMDKVFVWLQVMSLSMSLPICHIDFRFEIHRHVACIYIRTQLIWVSWQHVSLRQKFLSSACQFTPSGMKLKEPNSTHNWAVLTICP